MTIAHDFAYARPATLEDALALLVEAGEGARVLAGGTDLVAWLRDDAIHPELLIDIKQLEGLDGSIEEGDGTFELGALVTFSDLLASGLAAEKLPLVVEAAGTVASVGVRNRATVVGNLCSAVPSCDAGPALLVYEASINVIGPDGAHSILMTEWFTGPRTTTLGSAEIVTGITIPAPGEHGACYAKLSRYRGEDLSQAGVAVVVKRDRHYRVAFGAVGPVAFRAGDIEAFLDGKELDEATLDGAVALVEDAIAPISDVRSTKEYRTHMCKVQLRRALLAAEARMRGEGPPYGEQVI